MYTIGRLSTLSTWRSSQFWSLLSSSLLELLVLSFQQDCLFLQQDFLLLNYQQNSLVLQQDSHSCPFPELVDWEGEGRSRSPGILILKEIQVTLDFSVSIHQMSDNIWNKRLFSYNSVFLCVEISLGIWRNSPLFGCMNLRKRILLLSNVSGHLVSRGGVDSFNFLRNFLC